MLERALATFTITAGAITAGALLLSHLLPAGWAEFTLLPF